MKILKNFKKTSIIISAILVFLVFSQTALGKRIFIDSGFVESVRNWLLGNPKINACDYKEGTIILIKPVATGVGEGRYEAGDIVEIRDGEELCKIAGNKDPFGTEEKTKLLPLYYPKKLTQEQKQKLLEPEIEEISNGNQNDEILKIENSKTENSEKQESKMLMRRKYGIDYTKILTNREILKIRDFKGLNKLPEVDLSSIIEKSPDQKSVVQIPTHLAKKEKTLSLFKNLKLKIKNLLAQPAMAGSGTKTICPAGQGCNYTTLSAWEAGEQANLTGQGPAIAQIKGDWSVATDTSQVVIDGWTTTANDYIYIYTLPEARHNGKWDETKYRLVIAHSSWWSPIQIQEEFTRIDGLQAKLIDSGGSYPSVISPYFNNANSDVRISNNIIVVDSTSKTGGAVNGIGVNNTYSNKAKIWNNIIYPISSSQYLRAGIEAVAGSGVTREWYIYNNTVYGWYIGIYNYSFVNTIVLKNNISYNNNDNYSGFFSASSTNNLSGPTQTDAPGSNPRNAVTVQFVDPDNYDFHLRVGDSAARGYGANLSNDANLAFSTDIDGENRPENGPWDIGADQVARTSQVNTSLKGRGPTNGLVGYWTFDAQDTIWTSATTGTTTDLSGNGNHGTITNMSRTSSPAPGISGQALSFDGVDDGITVSHNSGLQPSELTISLWIKPLSSGATKRIIDKGTTGYIIRRVPNNTIQFIPGFYNSNSSAPQNIWTHVVVTAGSSGHKIYINGSLDYSNTTPYSPSGTSNLIIGGALDKYYGLIDDVRIYNRALSADEVMELYKLGSRKFQLKK
jgi:hypothetical protein